MTQPQPGDKVRIVIEGDVTADWAQTESLIQANGGTVVSLEVVAPPLSVGARINPADFFMVPKGTLARDANGILYFRYGNSKWAGSDESIWYDWELRFALTIVALP